MNKQTRKKIQICCGLMLLLGAGLSTPALAQQLPGELSGIVEYYDPVNHRLYLDGESYLLTNAAEAELLKATPGASGFVGQEIYYSETAVGDGEPWIDRLFLKD